MDRRTFIHSVAALGAGGVLLGQASSAEAAGATAMQKLARLLYNRKVLGVLPVGSRHVTSVRLRLPVPPERLDLYRSLLPPELSMPAVPRIYIYISEFNGTFPVKIEGGYREAAVCIKAACQLDSRTDPKQGGWSVLEMPVSNQSALDSGLLMGYPKYMADISLDSRDGAYEGVVKVEGRELFRMNYSPAEVEVPALDEEEMTVPFYLVVGGQVNIMSNEVVEQKTFSCAPGLVRVRINSTAPWTGLLDGPEVQGPGVLKIITGQFNLTRRSR